MNKKIFVTLVPKKDIEAKWGFKFMLPMYKEASFLYIEAYPKGRPRWKTSLAFTEEELQQRGDYTIV